MNFAKFVLMVGMFNVAAPVIAAAKLEAEPKTSSVGSSGAVRETPPSGEELKAKLAAARGEIAKKGKAVSLKVLTANAKAAAQAAEVAHAEYLEAQRVADEASVAAKKAHEEYLEAQAVVIAIEVKESVSSIGE